MLQCYSGHLYQCRPTLNVRTLSVPPELQPCPPAGCGYGLLSSSGHGQPVRDNDGWRLATPTRRPVGWLALRAATFSGIRSYYYYFFNWQVGGECVGASRTPIQVNVTPGRCYAAGGRLSPAAAARLTS